MVSAPVAPPVVKSLEDTDAVQKASSAARASVTVTAPRAPLAISPGAAADRLAVSGTVIESGPVLTANVTVFVPQPAMAAPEGRASTPPPPPATTRARLTG